MYICNRKIPRTILQLFEWTHHDTVSAADARRWLESNFDVKLAESTRDTPRVRLLVFIVEWLNLLSLLGTTQTRRVGKLEELRSKLD